MKKILIVLSLVLFVLIFISSCNKKQITETPTTTQPTTILSTTTTTTSISTTVNGIPLTTALCNPRLIKKKILENGTQTTYCATPEELKLQPCSTDSDCDSEEECIDGFCESIYGVEDLLCDQDSDCPKGQICKNNICVIGTTTTTTTTTT